MAELQRNQRGKIGSQHVKAPSAVASVHVRSHLTHPDQPDGTNQIDHDTGVYVPYSFSNNVMGSFTSPSN